MALRHLASLLTAIILLHSCSMMTEDLEPCEQVVRLHFKYDYNIQRADMFSNHVGEVRLFVVDDATGQVVKQTTVSNRDNANAILQHPSDQYFCIEMRDLLPTHSYRFVAVAQQRPYDETSIRQEDRFLCTFPGIGQDATNLSVELTHEGKRGATTEPFAVNAPTCGLDTLWMGHTTKSITIPQTMGSYTINDTISMVRDTKYLTISLRQLGEPTNIKHEDYRIEITDANSLLGWNNEVLPSASLLYTPHFQRTTEVLDKDNNVTARAAHYDISFSRLMYHKGADAYKNAVLKVINNKDNSVVAAIDLPATLSQGRNAYELYNYSSQEYLDREYDYDMDLFLQNGTWSYLDLRINILSWAMRFQNVNL